MHPLAAYAIALAATFTINLPFGYWRQGLRKLSPAWFVAIHAPVPMVILLRFMLGLPFRWTVLPFFVVAYFAGQFVGSRLRLRRTAARLASRGNYEWRSFSRREPAVTPALRRPRLAATWDNGGPDRFYRMKAAHAWKTPGFGTLCPRAFDA